MPKYTYTGETHDGQPVKETVSADDRYSVYDIARQNGHIVKFITTSKVASLAGVINMEKINVFLSRVSQDQLVIFSRNMSAMLKAGLSLSRALSVSERQSSNPRMKNALTKIQESINQGRHFHESLAEFPSIFSKLFVSMVRAGEESGGMADSLETIALQLRRASELKKKIRGAMIYPAIVITAMFVIGFLMMILVVPTLTKTFKELGVDLPTTTKVIIAVSDFLSQHTLISIGIILGVIFGFIWLHKIPVGRRGIEWILLHFPVINSLVKETNSARTARTLSSLLLAGVDVIQAITITEDVVQNSYYKGVMREAAKRVEKGQPLSEAYVEATHLYPVLFGEMIMVGEETGQISNMLIEVADFYESEVERKTRDLSTVIEPILMIVIGTGVGFFALAMISPIYSIADSI